MLSAVLLGDFLSCFALCADRNYAMKWGVFHYRVIVDCEVRFLKGGGQKI
jgi:hypothetical protein